MATITARKRADGTMAYRAAVRVKKDGVIVHQEAQTFDQRKLAERWAKLREIELQKPGGLERAKGGPTIGDLIAWYLKAYGEGFGRTKISALKQMLRFDIADLSALNLTSGQLIRHVEARRKEGTGPSTVNNDLIWLGVLFRAARPALDLDLRNEVIDDAMTFCRTQKLVTRSAQRDRRPTPKELKLLNDFFSSRDGRAELPMVDLVWFAIYSGRRQEEITLLRWEDNHARHHTGVVRDLKHPREKKGNHRTFKYTKEAWEIVKRQPKTSEFIFPYNSKSISAAFTRACKMVEIEDLHYHDLRHEATSRLFEAGYSITEVQQFTLHTSWETLRRYTHLKPKDVKHRK